MDNNTFWLLLLPIGGYLLGSLSAAIITCRLLGLPDPRTIGSNNPGATNVLRTGNKKAAALTLFGDLLKGLLAVLIARLLTADETILALTALAAFLGHLYPVFFGFKGGKGVATALGVFLGLSWLCGLLTIITWLSMTWLFRTSSLSALTAFALAPVYMALSSDNAAFLIIALIISSLLFWRHRSNIRKLLNGDGDRLENKESK
ncbi:MAG: glycerol-3-phosphate 1-O-acyltransferase PlsY [Gammaproteobacteria bacterium]|nr:glycerol-3-phosphate 1-O-acyltransferase PlsY [Gammaproteobacteria bacterium]